MKTFRMTNDDNRLYLQNIDRVSVEKELDNLICYLREIGCHIGAKVEYPTEDIYPCEINGIKFEIISDSEESLLYSKNLNAIDYIEKRINA